MQAIQSFSATSAPAQASSPSDRTEASSTAFDHLLNNLSKPETQNEPVKKKVEEKPPEETEAKPDTSAQPDNLLAMLLNSPTAAAAPPVVKPLPAAQAETAPAIAAAPSSGPLLEAMAQSLESQLKSSEKAISSEPQPPSSPALNARAQLALESEKFELVMSKERRDVSPEASSLGPSHTAPVKHGIEAPSAASETQAKSHVSTGFGQEGWDKAISQRVTWMVQDQLKSATLTLNPPHMGPIQVHVQLDNQQINVQFFSGQAEVRQALQEAIPALESMMNQSGLQLGQSDVSDQQPRSQGQSGPARNPGQGTPSDDLDATAAPLSSPRTIASGLLSTFA